MDDILQNKSHSKRAESSAPSLETATPDGPDPQAVISPETSSHSPDNSTQFYWRQLLPPQVLCCVYDPALYSSSEIEEM